MWITKKTENIFVILSLILCIRIFFSIAQESRGYHKNVEQHVFKNEKVSFRLVTAFSDNHLNEAITSCTSLAKLPEVESWQNGYMIAFLLENISSDRINQYQNACPFVEIRKFNFDKYPEYVRNLLEYRWKPLIIQEILEEFKYIFYFDTITAFNDTATETIENIFDMLKTKYSTCGLRQFVKTNHTIFATTHPSLYKIFDFDPKKAKQHMMYMAGFLTIVRNQYAINIINTWAKCALEEYCMAPLNSRLRCNGKKLRKGEYADCHRYDQAVLAILLVKQCTQRENYFHESSLIYAKMF